MAGIGLRFQDRNARSRRIRRPISHKGVLAKPKSQNAYRLRSHIFCWPVVVSALPRGGEAHRAHRAGPVVPMILRQQSRTRGAARKCPHLVVYECAWVAPASGAGGTKPAILANAVTPTRIAPIKAKAAHQFCEAIPIWAVPNTRTTMIGCDGSGKAYEDRQRISSQRERKPTEGDDKDRQDDADDQHGGASETKFRGLRLHHPPRRTVSIAYPGRNRTPHLLQMIFLPPDRPLYIPSFCLRARVQAHPCA